MIEKSLVSFLESAINGSQHTALLDTLSIPRDATKDIVTYKPDIEYHCYYDLGIALMFEKGVLSAIEYYKPNNTKQESSELHSSPPSKYKNVDSVRIPASIGYHATAVQLVEKFGEPTEKGGGMKQHIDIWMRWKDMEVGIPSRDWDAAKDVEWSSLIIFKE